MITPKAKVCEVLKKVQKNWSHELKRASNLTGRLPDRYRLRMTNWPLYSNRVMWGGMV